MDLDLGRILKNSSLPFFKCYKFELDLKIQWNIISLVKL